MAHEKALPRVLGPFIGHTTATSATLWLQIADIPLGEAMHLRVHLREGALSGPEVAETTLTVRQANCGTGVVELKNLRPDTHYYYWFKWRSHEERDVDLFGLTPDDLNFKTLPENGFDERLDFLLMTCHDPDQKKDDGFEGFAVWSRIPEILRENENVRFAILGGDQIYADAIEKEALAERDPQKRLSLYLQVYRRYWRRLEYRRVLCSLPSYLMWDDHDITDGWGSREDSFKPANERGENSEDFKTEWVDIFDSARTAFQYMQAARNPAPLSEKGFDCCFRIGRAGFVLADLRSNRNARKRIVWLPEQYEAIHRWIEKNRSELDNLFFVSPVVFSHGDPQLDELTRSMWPIVMWCVAKIANCTKRFKGAADGFNKQLGDLRDDISDSWGSEVNKEEADEILDLLFELQNPQGGGKRVNAVILSGDIHTAGYSTIYSLAEEHSGAAVIPHVVASPVAYSPFSWPLEAVYRYLTKAVNIGAKGRYLAQVSHHFCYRNVVVLSIRSHGEDSFLKVKYYLEGFPEPQIMYFDLNRGSHRESISWSLGHSK